MQNRTDALFTPYPLGPHVLKNRLVALPVYTGYAHSSGRVSQLMLDHYAGLAASGVAMVVVANAAVAGEGRTSRFCLRIDSDDCIDGLSTLAETIKREDAVACLQLNHAGALARSNHSRQPASTQTRHLGFKVSALDAFTHLPLDILVTDMGTAEAIIQIARDQIFDTVIMGKRGASGIKRWLMGSVSAKVLTGLPDHTLFFVD